ncbi:MAG: SWIM zinc finger family protein [Spirochaetales bacterium]|nr:SWIM zinc finger family protein [Spirochaetales bacterium]
MAKISKTWWGDVFMRALEQFLDDGRLKRGRSYCSEHRILSFEINDNYIKAKVRGNKNPYFGVYKEPRYTTQITLTTFSDAKWKKVIKKLSSHAAWISKLLMNEMPDNIEDAFREFNLHLLPQKSMDFNTNCSCPDYANPCKHIAGVYYRVASMLDTDPFLMFQLRGLSKETLQKELGKSPLGQALLSRRLGPEDVELISVDSIYTHPEKMNLNKTISLKEFWCGKKHQSLKNDKTHQPQNISALLIKKQGDYPSFWERDNSFIETMEAIYDHIRLKNKDNL